MKNQKRTLREAAEDGRAVALFNSNGDFVEVNSVGAEVHRRSKDELLGMAVLDLLSDPRPEHGQILEKALNGELETATMEIIRGDGTVALMKSEVELVEIDGEPHLRSEFEVVETVEDAPSFEAPDESTFDDITAEELDELTQNIRVDAPDGEMPLNAIMLDLAVGHNEIEQYKQGALTLHKAVDERLQEEEKRNPDSKTCDVLREVKKSAFGLYLRIQRGDQELHGERDGKYSGYFN